MIKSKFILLAKSATVDSLTSQLSINSVIEELSAPLVPSVLGESVVVVVFERDENDDSYYDIMFNLYSNNRKVGHKEIGLDFKDFTRNRLLLSLPILSLTEFGKLKFEFTLKSKVIASLIVNVIKAVPLANIPNLDFHDHPKPLKKSLTKNKR
ncbi:MAG TPA: hypothetical protein PLI68_11305 [Bacteroidia bacterium]|nr:hypothetical protein [Bacteroidia bacterium]